MNNYTSIEQSKKLVELGLSRDTADMVYQYNFIKKVNCEIPNVVLGSLHDTTLRNIPCWSLGALLELTSEAACADEVVHLEIESAKVNPETHIYIESIYGGPITRGNYFGKNSFDAVYNVVVWSLKNGYIKTEKK